VPLEAAAGAPSSEELFDPQPVPRRRLSHNVDTKKMFCISKVSRQKGKNNRLHIDYMR
jgi:hypothetical protein